MPGIKSPRATWWWVDEREGEGGFGGLRGWDLNKGRGPRVSVRSPGEGRSLPGDPGKGGVGAGDPPCPGPARGSRGREGGHPGEEAEPQPSALGVPEKGPAYLGFVEQEPHEGGEQQGRGERGARPQLLGEGGKGGCGGLLGQGHGVRGAHADGRAAGSTPRLTLANGARGSTARCHGPDAQAGEAATGHRPRRPAATATAGRTRAPPPQPPRRTPPTAPAPALSLSLSGRLAAPPAPLAARRQRRGGTRAPAPPLLGPAPGHQHADPSEAEPPPDPALPAGPPTAWLPPAPWRRPSPRAAETWQPPGAGITGARSPGPTSGLGLEKLSLRPAEDTSPRSSVSRVSFPQGGKRFLTFWGLQIILRTR